MLLFALANSGFPCYISYIMKKDIFWIALLSFLLILAFIITTRVFSSEFAESTVDCFAFFAGIFLVVEGAYRIFSNMSSPLSCQLLRTFRAIIGVCIVTIHILQFMYY